MDTQQLLQIPADQIKENPVRLRDLDREDEQYLGIVNSIRARGFTSTLLVTHKPEHRDEATGVVTPAHYELIDGLQRFNAGKDLGMTVFPCIVGTPKDANDLLAQQLVMNFHRVDTKPAAYARQLQRMIRNNNGLTMAELSAMVGTHPSTISARLKLLKLGAETQKLVDANKITLINAEALAKLDEEEQAPFVEQAMTLAPAEFAAAVNKRVKEIRDGVKKGQTAEDTFAPIPVLRKSKEIQDEAANPQSLRKAILDSGITDPVAIVQFALKWVVKLDPASVAEQKARHDQRLAERAAAKQQREADRLRKQAEKGKDAWLEFERTQGAAEGDAAADEALASK